MTRQQQQRQNAAYGQTWSLQRRRGQSHVSKSKPSSIFITCCKCNNTNNSNNNNFSCDCVDYNRLAVLLLPLFSLLVLLLLLLHLLYQYSTCFRPLEHRAITCCNYMRCLVVVLAAAWAIKKQKKKSNKVSAAAEKTLLNPVSPPKLDFLENDLFSPSL